MTIPITKDIFRYSRISSLAATQKIHFYVRSKLVNDKFIEKGKKEKNQ